jgi:hypothetical protein
MVELGRCRAHSKYSLSSEEACRKVASSVITLAQHTALELVAQSACSFVGRHPCIVALVGWEQELSSKGVSYEPSRSWLGSGSSLGCPLPKSAGAWRQRRCAGDMCASECRGF